MSILKLFKATKMMKLVPLAIFVVCGVLFVARVDQTAPSAKMTPTTLVEVPDDVKKVLIVPETYNAALVRTQLLQDKIRRLMARNKAVARERTGPNTTELTRHVQIFYYAPVKWFKEDGMNSSRDTSRETPNIIFYPARGLYTPSREIFQEHCRDIRVAGIGVLVVSWTPAFNEKLLRVLMNVTKENNLTVAVSIDTYPGRSVDSVESDIKFFCDTFSDYLHRVHVMPRNITIIRGQPVGYPIPMTIFYIKEPFLLPWTAWRGIRRSCNALLIGHIITEEHAALSRRAGFDGFYTHLGSNGATYASTWKHWQHLNDFATQYRMLFIPSVAPGFAERKKSMRQRHRSGTQYYAVAWRTAIRLGMPLISVSSYNDWTHGDQIEDAVSHVGFRDYSYPAGYPHIYLDLTAYWIETLRKQKSQNPPDTCSALFNNTVCL